MQLSMRERSEKARLEEVARQERIEAAASGEREETMIYHSDFVCMRPQFQGLWLQLMHVRLSPLIQWPERELRAQLTV